MRCDWLFIDIKVEVTQQSTPVYTRSALSLLCERNPFQAKVCGVFL